MDKIEEWRDVPNYEGYYQVSNLGNVRSLDRVVFSSKNNGRFDRLKGRQLKYCIGRNGYAAVKFCKNGKKKQLQIHQLVAMAFLGHKPCGFELVVDHINGVKIDNRAINLQVISNKENTSKDKSGYSSEYVGVIRVANNIWSAQIVIRGTCHHLGNFKDELAAKLAYDAALESIGTKSELEVLNKHRRVKSSKYKGVSYHKSSGNWRAFACRNRKYIHFGNYKTEHEAHQAYIKGIKKLQKTT